MRIGRLHGDLCRPLVLPQVSPVKHVVYSHAPLFTGIDRQVRPSYALDVYSRGQGRDLGTSETGAGFEPAGPWLMRPGWYHTFAVIGQGH